MPKLNHKLSRSEMALAVLVAGVWILISTLFFLQNREVETQERLAPSVRRAEITLEETRQEADLAPLETKERQLTEALAKIPPLQTDKGGVTLALWRWADTTGAKIQAMGYAEGTTAIADTKLQTHKYTLTLRGDSQALHGFLSSITSTYNPLVENLSMRREPGQGSWQMNLMMLLYSKEA